VRADSGVEVFPIGKIMAVADRGFRGRGRGFRDRGFRDFDGGCFGFGYPLAAGNNCSGRRYSICESTLL
jgi:hypothetical protein